MLFKRLGWTGLLPIRLAGTWPVVFLTTFRYQVCSLDPCPTSFFGSRCAREAIKHGFEARARLFVALLIIGVRSNNDQ